MNYLLPRLFLLLPACLLVATQCDAALTINISTSSTEATFSISGSGTVNENSSGNIDLDDFGSIFDTLVVADTNLSFSSPVVFDVFRPSSGSNLTRSYSQVNFDNQVVSDDLILVADATNQFNAGDQFTVNAVATISGDFSNMSTGTFTSTTNDAVTDRFGPATLTVTAVAVPEPTSLVALACCGLGIVINRRRRV